MACSSISQTKAQRNLWFGVQISSFQRVIDVSLHYSGWKILRIKYFVEEIIDVSICGPNPILRNINDIFDDAICIFDFQADYTKTLVEE